MSESAATKNNVAELSNCSSVNGVSGRYIESNYSLKIEYDGKEFIIGNGSLVRLTFEGFKENQIRNIGSQHFLREIYEHMNTFIKIDRKDILFMGYRGTL